MASGLSFGGEVRRTAHIERLEYPRLHKRGVRGVGQARNQELSKYKHLFPGVSGKIVGGGGIVKPGYCNATLPEARTQGEGVACGVQYR